MAASARARCTALGRLAGGLGWLLGCLLAWIGLAGLAAAVEPGSAVAPAASVAPAAVAAPSRAAPGSPGAQPASAAVAASQPLREDGPMPALQIGYLVDDPPFSSRDAAGVPHGMSIALIEALARRTPFRIAGLVPLQQSQARRALTGGTVDLVFGLPSDRAVHESLRMIGPVMVTPLAIATADRLDLVSVSRLAGLPVARPITTGTVAGLDELDPPAQVLICGEEPQCLQWLAEDRVQAVIGGLPAMQEALATEPEFARFRITGTVDAGSTQQRYVSLLATRASLAERVERALHAVMQTDYPTIQQNWSAQLRKPKTDWTSVRRWAVWLASVAGVAVAGLVWHNRVADRLHERARRAEARADHYMGFLAHELRNTLQSVVGSVLKWRRQSAIEGRGSGQEWSPQEMRKLVTALSQGAARSLGHLDGLLDEERLAAGTIGLQRRPEPMPAVLHDLIEELQPQAAGHGRSIRLNLEGARPGWWLIDAVRLQQVMRLVLNQALRSPVRSPIEVEVAAGPSARGPAWMHWAVAIRSEGWGPIEQTPPERAFEVDDAGRTIPLGAPPVIGAGAGRSLRLARALADALGGTLELDRRPARQTGLILHLDLQAAPDGEAAHAPPLKRVLLVDDAVAYAMLLERALQEQGIGVRVAHSLDAAALALSEAARQGPWPDLVLCDRHLPDGGLVELLGLTRQLATGERRALPVIGLSADFDTADIRRLTEDGAMDLLTKDADVDRLVRRVQRIWGTWMPPGAMPSPAAAPHAPLAGDDREPDPPGGWRERSDAA